MTETSGGEAASLKARYELSAGKILAIDFWMLCIDFFISETKQYCLILLAVGYKEDYKYY